MHYCIVCAIAKDEDKNLREWVSYHLMIGFDKVFIFDNASSVPVRDVLHDYVSSGVVVVHEIAGDGVQLSAYASFIKEFRGVSEWCAFIDVDEYIVPSRDNDVKDVLDRYIKHGGLGVSWKIFGSDGHIKRPNARVIESYRTVLSCDFHIKSIVRLRCVDHVISPHHFKYSDGFHCVNEHGVPVFGAKSYHSSEIIQINHYYYKSQQDYEEKIARGFATPIAGVAGYDLDRFYRQANVVGEVDTSILRFGGLLRRYEKIGHMIASNRLMELSELVDGQILEKVQHILIDEGSESALAYLSNVLRYHDRVGVGIAKMKILAGEGEFDLVLAEASRLLNKFSGDVGLCESVFKALASAYRDFGMHGQASGIESMLASS